MFSTACRKIREATYFVRGSSVGGTSSDGTAFMIAPGILATVGHVLYKNEKDSSSFQDNIRVMRAPEIKIVGGSTMEIATVIGVEPEYDIGLLKIQNPRDTTCVAFMADPPPIGTNVGALGFPLISMPDMRVPVPRFQGGYISAHYSLKGVPSGRELLHYETDVPMFKSSSGSPGFLIDGRVFGLHAKEWHDGKDEKHPGQRAFSVWVPISEIIAFAKGKKIDIGS